MVEKSEGNSVADPGGKTFIPKPSDVSFVVGAVAGKWGRGSKGITSKHMKHGIHHGPDA
jgi:hypothetical protein